MFDNLLQVLSNNQFNTSIWGDEGFSAILSMKSLPNIIKIIARDTSPPLWNIWEWLFFNLFGTGEIVIRSLALIFFLGTIFFTFKIGELLWDRRAGFLAAVLTFLNPFFFTYAFEGRMYSIMSLGVAASMYFFLKIIYSKGSVKKTSVVGYVLSTLWAMYSHHFAIFVLIVQGGWFLFEILFGNKKAAKVIFKSFLLIGLGYLPWVIPLYNQTSKVGGGFWLGTPTVADARGLLEKYLGSGIVHPWQQAALVGFLIIFVLRKWSLDKKALILLSWFLGPITLTWIVSQFFQSIFFDRYLLYTVPAAMILAGSRGRKLTAYVLPILVFVLVSIDVYYFTHPVKRPFRELSSLVKQEMRAGDFLINWNSSAHHLWETKYYGIDAPIYIPDGGELPFFVGTALMDTNDLIDNLPNDAKRVGVVTSGSVDDIRLPGYTLSTERHFQNSWEGSAGVNFAWFEPN